VNSHHPSIATALDKLREAAALMSERNRLQQAANQSKALRRFSMAEMTEQSAERCQDTAYALLVAATDLLTRARADEPSTGIWALSSKGA
jgi:hypothetical protein